MKSYNGCNLSSNTPEAELFANLVHPVLFPKGSSRAATSLRPSYSGCEIYTSRRCWIGVTPAKIDYLVLSGDLYHYPEERELKRMPDEDKTTGTVESRQEVEELVRRTRAAVDRAQHGVLSFGAKVTGVVRLNRRKQLP